MTHPGTARDVDLNTWLDTIAFHPANTEAKQVGHEYVRSVIAGTGASLHDIVPPGPDKSTAFRLLGDVLMYVNRALAVGGGPVLTDPRSIESMREVIEGASALFDGAGASNDPRIDQYKQGQLDQAVSDPRIVNDGGWRLKADLEGVTLYARSGGVLLQTGTSEPVELDREKVKDLVSRLLQCLDEAWEADGVWPVG